MNRSPRPRHGRILTGLERATAFVERPLTRLVGSHRLDPLPHAGTISMFLFVVVVVTGVYLTFFFQYGYQASYQAVAALEAHPVQRVVRAVHRYASAALVVTVLVHGWRTLVMRRFGGNRRWRWFSGVVGVILVWVAGVTGYWMIWDERAQALDEALIRVLERTAAGVRFVAHWFFDPTTSGWQIILILFALHLVFTAGIGVALWYHLRHTRFRWWPPRFWMWAMGGALVAASVLLPAGMLPPADWSKLVGTVPLDPLFLFLVPPALSLSPWVLTVVVLVVFGAVAGFPWLARRTREDVVVLHPDRCTGCELCVADCPYEAMRMVEAEGRTHEIVEIDPNRCVGCGICIGSCAFGALTLPGFDPAPPPDVAGRRVVVACERHIRLGTVDGGEDVALVPVRCAGMLEPRYVGALAAQGATAVQVVGCGPADCTFGIGNELTEERMEGTRRPHLPRKYQGATLTDWVAPGELADAISRPGAHPTADPDELPRGGRRLLAAVLVVVASVVAVRLVTDWPFDATPASVAELAVVVEHAAGAQIEGVDHPTGAPGPSILTVTVDGDDVVRRPLAVADVDGEPGVVGMARVAVEPGSHHVTVALEEPGEPVPTVVFDDDVDAAAQGRLVVAVRDVPPPPGPKLGKELFNATRYGGSTGCVICHSVREGEVKVGPSLYGVADRAVTRVPGLSAEEYLRQSILDPAAYTVEGFRKDQMPDTYAETLTEEEVEALVAYLLTLREGS